MTHGLKSNTTSECMRSYLEVLKINNLIHSMKPRFSCTLDWLFCGEQNSLVPTLGFFLPFHSFPFSFPFSLVHAPPPLPFICHLETQLLQYFGTLSFLFLNSPSFVMSGCCCKGASLSSVVLIPVLLFPFTLTLNFSQEF